MPAFFGCALIWFFVTQAVRPPQRGCPAGDPGLARPLNAFNHRKLIVCVTNKGLPRNDYRCSSLFFLLSAVCALVGGVRGTPAENVNYKFVPCSASIATHFFRLRAERFLSVFAVKPLGKRRAKWVRS